MLHHSSTHALPLGHASSPHPTTLSAAPLHQVFAVLRVARVEAHSVDVDSIHAAHEVGRGHLEGAIRDLSDVANATNHERRGIEIERSEWEKNYIRVCEMQFLQDKMH